MSLALDSVEPKERALAPGWGLVRVESTGPALVPGLTSVWAAPMAQGLAVGLKLETEKVPLNLVDDSN